MKIEYERWGNDSYSRLGKCFFFLFFPFFLGGGGGGIKHEGKLGTHKKSKIIDHEL